MIVGETKKNKETSNKKGTGITPRRRMITKQQPASTITSSEASFAQSSKAQTCYCCGKKGHIVVPNALIRTQSRRKIGTFGKLSYTICKLNSKMNKQTMSQ
jgi:hypothetical protein